MELENLSWLLVILSLTGYVFVIKKNVTGQWLWAVANVGWIIYDISIEAYSQALLFAVYLVMCVWGIVAWSRESDKATSES